ncbi:MAG: hypothetical protein AAF926_02095 [Pseudomonadota bacterium]
MTLVLGVAYEGAYGLLGDDTFSFRSAIIRGVIFSAVMTGAAFLFGKKDRESHG